MPRRTPAIDPELKAHQEWLGYLQPVGLVVAPAAMQDAGWVARIADSRDLRVTRLQTSEMAKLLLCVSLAGVLAEGTALRTTRGARLTALRPTLSEYILKMPRGAQVIYPKDLGPILMVGDIFPGARVLEDGDLISLDIRTCLYHLGEITGEITTEDKLDYIFSKFCIGK